MIWPQNPGDDLPPQERYPELAPGAQLHLPNNLISWEQFAPCLGPFSSLPQKSRCSLRFQGQLVQEKRGIIFRSPSSVAFTRAYAQREQTLYHCSTVLAEWKVVVTQSCRVLLTEITLFRIMRAGHSAYLKLHRESQQAKRKNLLWAGI